MSVQEMQSEVSAIKAALTEADPYCPEYPELVAALIELQGSLVNRLLQERGGNA